MGLENTSKKIYLNIQDGKIVKKVTEGTKDAVSRVNKNNATVWELKFNSLKGYLKNVSVRENDYGKQWELSIVDGQDDFILQFPYSSGYANGFLMSIKNADISRPIRFAPWMKEVDGKKKTALYLNQDEVDSVEWYYTKDDPKGLPQMVKTKFKGQDVWDDTERMAFLEKMVMSEIVPQLKANLDLQVPSAEIQENKETFTENPEQNTGDDLPF